MNPNRPPSASPYIGILIGKDALTRLNQQISNHPSYFRFIELHHASKIANVNYYFFSTKEIHFSKERILGTFYNERTAKWHQAWFKYPHVLYNRIVAPKISEKRINRFLGICRSRNIPSINSRHYFNKWEFHRTMHANPRIRPHLPLTEKAQKVTGSLLSKAFSHSRQIYIKGSEGRMGEQVMRVEKRPDGRYIALTHKEQINKKTFKSINELLSSIRQFHKGRQVIIQSAIPLLEYDGRLVDFRAEVQRDGKGALKIIAILARISQPNSPITTHASSTTFAQFFRKNHVPLEKIAVFQKNTELFITKVYKAVEKAYGPFGELGIDFGIDREGKLWLIECNARTAKMSLYKVYNLETIREAFLNPLLYAKHLLSKKKVKNRH